MKAEKQYQVLLNEIDNYNSGIDQIINTLYQLKITKDSIHLNTITNEASFVHTLTKKMLSLRKSIYDEYTRYLQYWSDNE